MGLLDHVAHLLAQFQRAWGRRPAAAGAGPRPGRGTGRAAARRCRPRAGRLRRLGGERARPSRAGAGVVGAGGRRHTACPWHR
ncbi:hypothetical protein G6F58_013655 [Rhizopus delemar]|nr:hypothetical protein G6F58_013655 [Rhizopus delemar]